MNNTKLRKKNWSTFESTIQVPHPTSCYGSCRQCPLQYEKPVLTTQWIVEKPLISINGLILMGILWSASSDAGSCERFLRLNLRSDAFTVLSRGNANRASLSAELNVSCDTNAGSTLGSSMDRFFASAISLLAFTIPKSGRWLCCFVITTLSSLSLIFILPFQFECLSVQCYVLAVSPTRCLVNIKPLNRAFLPPLPDGHN